MCITVEDTGIGIPEDQHESIFDAYTQHHGEDEYKYGGIGLGLAITQRFVEKMNGEISVESSLGKGSVFHITLKEVEVSELSVENAHLKEITSEDENGMELENGTKEEFSPEMMKKLPELVQILKERYKSIWEELIDTLTVNEIVEFAGEIIEAGTKHMCSSVENWAIRLSKQAGMFDIEAMTTTLAAFPEIIKDIESKM